MGLLDRIIAKQAHLMFLLSLGASVKNQTPAKLYAELEGVSWARAVLEKRLKLSDVDDKEREMIRYALVREEMQETMERGPLE